MPLSLSFVLVGFFLWVAENGATLLGAWQYPDQEQVWQMVHVGKWGSWALLVSLSFVLVAAAKMQEGRFYGEIGAVPTVTGSLPVRRRLFGAGWTDAPPVRSGRHAGEPLERRREGRLGPVPPGSRR
jgi:hypothetical protein